MPEAPAAPSAPWPRRRPVRRFPQNRNGDSACIFSRFFNFQKGLTNAAGIRTMTGRAAKHPLGHRPPAGALYAACAF